MITKIGKFDAKTGTVPVRFEQGGLVHERSVNAVLNPQGTCDRKATAARVAEVALGVAHKFDAGLLGAAPLSPENAE